MPEYERLNGPERGVRRETREDEEVISAIRSADLPDDAGDAARLEKYLGEAI